MRYSLNFNTSLLFYIDFRKKLKIKKKTKT